jgi:hypothetical protein
VDQFPATCCPLGILADQTFELDQPIHFADRDVVILITDGFYEWANRGGEQFGLNRLEQIALLFLFADTLRRVLLGRIKVEIPLPAALLAALEACSLESIFVSRASRTPVPTFVSTSISPTVTSTVTPSLTVTPGSIAQPPVGTSTPTGTPSPSPTASLTGKATATPTATPGETPTPTPTPYPPGPPSKLGLFTTRADGQIDTLIRLGKPALIKTLNLDPNFARYIKENSPTTIVVGRLITDQLDLTADPIPLARAAAGKLLETALEPTRFQYFDAWEAYNEGFLVEFDQRQKIQY